MKLNTLHLSSPSFAAEDEKIALKLTLHGTSGSLSTITVYVLPPRGQAIDITSLFQDVSSTFPATFISLFQAEYTFKQKGLFVFLVHESSSGGVWITETYCVEWATRIDIPVSDLTKQRSDIQRIYGRLNRR
jgi:hypothetical protein